MSIALSAGRGRPGSTSDAFARPAGLHPELVRRFVALGLLDADAGRRRASCGSPRAQLRRGRPHPAAARRASSLNYAAIGLVLDLLDRIAALEAALRSRPRPTEDRPWT